MPLYLSLMISWVSDLSSHLDFHFFEDKDKVISLCLLLSVQPSSGYQGRQMGRSLWARKCRAELKLPGATGQSSSHQKSQLSLGLGRLQWATTTPHHHHHLGSSSPG